MLLGSGIGPACFVARGVVPCNKPGQRRPSTRWRGNDSVGRSYTERRCGMDEKSQRLIDATRAARPATGTDRQTSAPLADAVVYFADVILCALQIACEGGLDG